MANNLQSVLYIDDEEANIFMFEMLFKETFSLKTAESGFDGLELLKSHPEINIVISDMNMPKMNGLEFVNKAREDFKDISFYILSGYAIDDNIQDALENGVINGYMMKPFDYKTLLSTIGCEA